VYYRNATNGWVQLASSFLYYKTLEGNVNQVVKTGATGKIDGDLLPVSTQTFTSNGTWTKPAGLLYAVIECWGGGGSGGSAMASSSSYSAGGGGGGAYKRITIPAAKLSATEDIVVGAGGAARVLSGTNTTSWGNAGSQSSFGATKLIALGGALGRADNEYSPPSNIGGLGGVSTFPMSDGGAGGSAGAGGRPSEYGGAGGGGSRRDSDGDPSGAGAGGVSVASGNGGAGVQNAGNATAIAGVIPAGGGGGATASGATATSGAGARGQVIVTEYYN